MLNIADRKECFFDDYLIDTEKTTAEFRVHHPIRQKAVFAHDKPWDEYGSNFHNLIKDGDLYRMYYLGRTSCFRPTIVVCYAESRDGINWVQPSLGICQYNGSYDNNIILDHAAHTVGSQCAEANIDNFMVFIDENPACPANERYKAVALWNDIVIEKVDRGGLRFYTSADGIHFKPGSMLTRKGTMDTLNVCFWDKVAKKYRLYVRDYHVFGDTSTSEAAGDKGCYCRDIRYMESTDFKNWTDPVLIDFGDAEEIELYTNVIQPYPEAPHQLIGFPTRYYDRFNTKGGWNDCYEELCGKEIRKERMTHSPRYGTAVTDCLFIASRDGIHFKRYDEAFIRPQPERERNWVYGDGYLCRGMIETPSAQPGAETELSLYMQDICLNDGYSAQVIRYTIRKDGFVSLHAGGKEKVLLTKDFSYEGGALYVNFSTSAWGYMSFTLIDADGNRYESCEYFGNTTKRAIAFEDDVVAKLSGQPVRLEVRFRDADLYSIRFGTKE